MIVGTLRMLRQERGWTLDELASRAGTTKSYLSKVERGVSTPSIAVAVGLAKALGVDVAELFDADRESSGIEIHRADSGGDPTVPDAGSRYVSIAGRIPGKQLLPFLIYPPHSETRCVYSEHHGDELVVVRSGEVELRFPDRTEKLAVGDSAYFRGGIPHYFRSIGPDEAECLVVIAASGRDTGPEQPPGP